jgi:hypothetical protein
MNRAAASLLTATLALAGCATTSGLGSAADRLDNSAHRFYEEIYAYRAPPHATDDAAALAEATRDFRHDVDRSRSREELRPSFERVAQRYHRLREQVEERAPRGGNAQVAFDRVTEAYLDVDRAMNYAGSTARY